MNYIQAYYNLPLAIVQSENKAAYIQALIDTRQQENIEIFVSSWLASMRFYLLRKLKSLRR
jgi:hypothetical protein